MPNMLFIILPFLSKKNTTIILLVGMIFCFHFPFTSQQITHHLYMLFLHPKCITNPSWSLYFSCNHGQATIFFHTDYCKQSPCGSLIPSLTRSAMHYKQPRKSFRNTNQKTVRVRSTVNIQVIGVLCLEGSTLLCLINSYSSFTIKFRYSVQNLDRDFSSFSQETRLDISLCS